MNRKIAEPLPECRLCEAPTKRAAHDKNGGLCTACAAGIADTVRMVPPARPGVIQLDSHRRRKLLLAQGVLDDATAFVEGYTPPVPGQLELPEGE